MNILITGANRGIGKGLCSILGARDHTVTGTHRGAASEGMLSLDVTDPASTEALSASLEKQSLDCLVCNAGVYLDKGMQLDDLTADIWADTMAANVTGVFLTVKAALPALRRSTSGKIAIISSIMASDANAPGGAYVYRASKAAALNFGRNLAKDLGRDGIAVQIFHPGWVQTDMGGQEADLTLDQAVTELASRIEKISLDRNGAFLSYDGTEIPF